MSVEDLLAQFDEEDSNATKSALTKSALIAHDTNPDQYAANRNKTIKRGLPVALAAPAKRPSSWEDASILMDDFSRLVDNSPYTAAFLSNPENAKISYDDHPKLTKVETALTALKGAGKNIVGIAENVANQVTQLGAMTLTAIPNIIGSTGAEIAGAIVNERMPTLSGISDKFHENLGVQIYQPQTESGKQQVDATGKIMTAIPAAVDAIDAATGDTFKRNFPNTYAGVQVAGEFAPWVVFGKAVHSGIAERPATISDANANKILDIVNVAKESKLAKRDVETFKDFTASAGEMPTVTMPVEKFDSLLAEKKLKPEEVLTDTTQYHEAKFTDKPVEIPVSDIAANAEHITPEHIKDMSVDSKPSVRDIETKIEAEKVAEGKPEETPKPETNESRLAQRAEADAIEAKLTKDFGALPEYKTMSMKDQADRATYIMEADYEAAKRMAMGEELPPEGVREATMYEAVKIRAIKEGDVETVRKLATESTVPTRLTEYGQAIKAADSRLNMDPVRDIQEVIADRKENAKKQGLSPESTAKIDELTAKLDEAQTKLTSYEEELAKKHAEKVHKQVVTEIAKTTRKTTRQSSRAALDAEFKDLTSKLNSILNPNKLNVGIDPAAIPVLVEMAKNRIKAGVLTVEGVVDSVHSEVQRFIKGVSKREIRDAISGYGETSKMSQDEINIQLRELKRQARLVSALEDAQGGESPQRSGLQRDPVSDKVRELQKEVKQAMRESGLDVDSTKSPEEQWKTAQDARKTALKNQIADLKRQIETGRELAKKEAVKYDEEATKLAAERDALRTKWQEKKTLLEEMKKKGVPDEDPLITAGKKFMADTEKQIKAKEKALDKAIAEKQRRIDEHDLEPNKKQRATPRTPEISEKQSQLDKLNEEYKQMQKDAKPPKDPEAARLQSFKTRITNETARLEKALADGDFAKKERTPVTLDAQGKKLKAERDRAKENFQSAQSAMGTVSKEEAAQIVRLSKIASDARDAIESGGNRLDYGAARVAYENYVNDLKGANASIKTLLKNHAQELKTTWQDNKSKAVWDAGTGALKTITDNSIAMVASLDNSFLGRQGLKTLMTHPSAWWPGAKASFSDFANTLGGKNAHDAMMADIVSRPNYLNGEYQRAKIIALTEEQFPTTLPERIPVVGRVFKASEAAFTGSGMRMRTDLYDLLSTKAKENGVDMTNKAQAESLGKLINSLTSRGQWGNRGQSGAIRLILWAPKMLKGNIDVLTAHNFTAGLESKFARKEAVVNLLKIVAETATLMSIANALKPGSAELDPKSTDFGKIKVGETRFDITGGAASIVTLAARLLTNSSKNTQTGLVTEYGTGFGQRTLFDALIDFITNKTPPTTSVVVSWLKGKDREGEPFTGGNATYRAFTPISLQNAIKAKDDVSADKVAGVLVDLIGINANSYSDVSKQKRDIISRIRNGKPLLPDQQTVFDSMSPKEQSNIEKQTEMTAIQAAFDNLDIGNAIHAWSKATDSQRDELRDIYESKIDKYMLKTDIEGEDLDELNNKIQNAEERK